MTAFMPIWVMWLLACLAFGLRGLLPGYSSYNLVLDPFIAPLPPPTLVERMVPMGIALFCAAPSIFFLAAFYAQMTARSEPGRKRQFSLRGMFVAMVAVSLLFGALNFVDRIAQREYEQQLRAWEARQPPPPEILIAH